MDYDFYLFNELWSLKHPEYKDLEYALKFEKVTEDYSDFEEGIYDNPMVPLYECILAYLENSVKYTLQNNIMEFKMETEIYQTDSDYTKKQILELEAWVGKNIGTETYIEDGGIEDRQWYLQIFDLTWGEVNKIRNYECYFRVDNNIK